MKEIVAYCRVSTKQQGQSGLGLEAQRTAVEGYAKQSGARVTALYVEVESGKRADRPELAKALGHARRGKATLVVAKLDRLSRNVAFLSALMESKVPFVACDNPQATPLTIHILAAVAEEEVKAISKRTKATLAEVRKKGKLLGSARPAHWEGLCRCPKCGGRESDRQGCPTCGGTGELKVTRQEARLQGAKAGAAVSATVRAKAATEAYADLLPSVRELRGSGLSLQAIADKLNADGHTTRRGKPWNPVQVARVLDRAE